MTIVVMDIIDFLKKRRSVKAANLTFPAPSQEQLHDILTIAARVPDHGKQVPFYFLTIQGEATHQFGEIRAKIYAQKNPEATADKIEQQKQIAANAPLIVAVIHRLRPSKHPRSEQILTVGAACQNLILAAHAQGFAAQWLTAWSAYDNDVRAALGLDERDTVAGFIHIGTPAETPQDRDRPDLTQIVTEWTPKAVEQGINKGDQYDRPKFDLPK